MNSKTKHRLSDDQIVKLIRKQFGDDTPIGKIGELKGGMFNAAYYIEQPGGEQDLVLKVSVHPQAPLLTYEKNLMRTEVEVYRLVASATSVPTPRILGYDFSRSLIPSDYFFMNALKGQTMHSLRKKLKAEQRVKIKHELGGYFAQMHQIKGDYFGYFSEDSRLQFATWREAFRHMVYMILEDGKRLRVKLPYSRIEDILSRKEQLLEAVNVPGLVDFDLWPGNIFLTQQGDDYEIEAIVDFERSFWGDPYADFPPAFMLFKDVRQEKEFWSAYTGQMKDTKTITGDDQARMLLYKMYIFLIMAVETYRYGKIYGKLQFSYSKNVVMKCLKELET